MNTKRELKLRNKRKNMRLDAYCFWAGITSKSWKGNVNTPNTNTREVWRLVRKEMVLHDL